MQESVHACVRVNACMAIYACAYIYRHISNGDKLPLSYWTTLGATGNLVQSKLWKSRGPSDISMKRNPKKNLCAQDNAKIPEIMIISLV